MSGINNHEIEDFIFLIKFIAKGMGYHDQQEKNYNVIFRNATIVNSIEFDKKAYFGFINPEEELRGSYCDFSLVFFPQRDMSSFVVALGVGTQGFKNDLELASLPWVRRLFIHKQEGGDFFFKNDFTDIETSSRLYYMLGKNMPLKNVIYTYKKYLQACQLIDWKSTYEELTGESRPEEGNLIDNLKKLVIKKKGTDVNKEILKRIYKTKNEKIRTLLRWLAQFAKLKGLAKNETERKNIDNAIRTDLDVHKNLTDCDIYNILKKDRYVILQGAPGTGKTYNALKISNKNFKKGNVFFEQFHAETSYSDFVFGITPKLNSNNLIYEPKQGILYKAIKQAKDSKDNVLLIIDEINRANLSNVLGPVFYLFEKNHDNRNVNLKLGDIELSVLPENLYVIGTMNTADRSLAVVDFALRRRFTWITLRPCIINSTELNKGEYFHKEEFNKFNELFEKYATDEELNLQPGQSYFITKSPQDSSMNDRLQYELMPLMKEYFNEGYLERAKDEFCDYFYVKISKLMYE